MSESFALSNGSMFFIPEDHKKQKKPKEIVKRSKSIEYDPEVKQEMEKRNRNKKNPGKPLHITWILKIKQDLEEKRLLKVGWKGDKIKFHDAGGKNTLPENVVEFGKKIKESKLKRKQKIESKILKKPKNQKNVKWEGKIIKFVNNDD